MLFSSLHICQVFDILIHLSYWRVACFDSCSWTVIFHLQKGFQCHISMPSTSAIPLSLSLFSSFFLTHTLARTQLWMCGEIQERVDEIGHCILVCTFGSSLNLVLLRPILCRWVSQIHLQTYWCLVRGDCVIRRCQVIVTVLLYSHVTTVGIFDCSIEVQDFEHMATIGSLTSETTCVQQTHK